MFKKLHLKSRFWYLIPFMLLAFVDSLTLFPILFGALKHIDSVRNSIGLVLLSILLYIIVIIFTWKVYRHVSHRPALNISQIIKLTKNDWKIIGWGFLSFIILTILNSLIAMHASSITTNQSELLIALKSNYIYKYGLIFCSVVLAPILEELLYRGVLMRIISQKLSILSIIISLIIFDCMHQGFTISAFISYGGLGLICGFMYAKSHSLKSNTFLHMFTNLLLYL